MNKRPGQVVVTVETGYCPFCLRVRNLRHEERHMGTLVRTTITCESCHRTLSSAMGVAGDETTAEEPAAVPATVDSEGPVPDTQAAAPKPTLDKPEAPPKPARAAAKPKATETPPKRRASRSRAERSQ